MVARLAAAAGAASLLADAREPRLAAGALTAHPPRPLRKNSRGHTPRRLGKVGRLMDRLE